MLKNIIYLFSSNIISQFLNFLSGIIVIKMISTDDFGKYSVSTSFINIFVIILSGLLTSALRRFTAYYRGNEEFEKISGILKLSLIYSSILTIFLTFPFLFFPKFISKFFLNSEDYSKFLFFYSFSIPFMIFSIYLSSYLSGFEKFKEVAISNNILPNIFRLIFLIFWWIFLPFKEIGAILSLCFKSFTNFISLYYFSRENLKFLKYKSAYEFLDWFRFSIPSFLRYGFSYLTDNIGIVILGSLKDSLSAGIYRGSNFIISILWSISNTFSAVLIPRIAFLISSNKEDLALSILRKYYILNTTLVFIITIFLIFFGKYLLLILGKDYVLGYDVLIILCFQVIIGTFSSSFEVYLEAKGRTDLTLINYIVYCIFGTISLYILTKIYSKEGTAYAYIIAIISISISRYILYSIVSKKPIYKIYDYFLFIFYLLFSFICFKIF